MARGVSKVGQRGDVAVRGGFDTETTVAGCQTLVPGVAPLTPGDRLALLANAPLLARRAQRPADHGLFDTNARNQIEMF